MNKQKNQRSREMRKVSLTIKTLAVLGIVFSFIGVNSASATPAITDKGAGCFVRVGPEDNDYVFDATCTAHDALKFDDEGNFEFYVYQDQGQLPEGSWRPSRAFRSTFEQCFNASFGVFCGTVTEMVSPSGEYKSSFNSY
jgi:hypothetical protein